MIKLNTAVMSDTHCEFHRDNGKSFVEGLDIGDADVLILAGDINIAKNNLLFDTLNLFCSSFEDLKIIYIHGNHEFYGSNREFVLDNTREAVKHNSNLIWLDNDIVTIEGCRFIGAPLWFPYDYENVKYEHSIGDFSEIEKYSDWVYSENRKAVGFLEKNVMEGDTVISHHLPSAKSVARQFHKSQLNRFFLCDIEYVIAKLCPALWIHGHTHFSLDYRIWKTKIVCNPFGYVAVEENRDFRERFILPSC